LAFALAQYGGVLGVGCFFFTAHRAAWLADKGVARVADVVDSVADAAVSVVDAAAVAGIEAVHFWTSVALNGLFLGLALGAWFWVCRIFAMNKKVRLRLSGMEPEANVVFTDEQLCRSVRNVKGMKACVEHVRLLHLSPEGRVRYEVQGSSVTPYSVTLDFRAFKQGSAPEYVVLGCNCMPLHSFESKFREKSKLGKSKDLGHFWRVI
jgi:hypothetical protein